MRVRDDQRVDAAESPAPLESDPGHRARRRPSPLQLAALVVALCFGFGVLGWVLAQPAAPPASDSVDVGFLGDMTTHHLQAVELSFDYLNGGTDPLLRQFAREIATSQAAEIGVMGHILEGWHRTPPNNGVVMAWMHQPLPAAAMPGLASQGDVDRLRAATGRDAGELFSRLMIVHHLGGLEMAGYASHYASTIEVRSRAAAMVNGQRGEINELERSRQRLGFTAV